MIKHLSIKVHGRVQGVFFRDAAKAEADKLGIRGFARNESDGSVYIEAEGGEEALARFAAWCKRGPRHADVSKIETGEGPVVGFGDFLVK